MKNSNCCAGCRFYHNKFKQCRKNPPAYSEGLNCDCFPLATGWCGEFESNIDEKLESDKVLVGILKDINCGVDRIADALGDINIREELKYTITGKAGPAEGEVKAESENS